LLAFQLLQVIMQIRFATMGTKNKHERNSKKSIEKVWNPKKGKNHKTKKNKSANTFFGPFLCFQVLQVIMQIRFATARKKKNISEALRKTQTKSGTLRKKRSTKHKRQICKHCFFGRAKRGIYNDGEEKKKNIRETLRKIQKTCSSSPSSSSSMVAAGSQQALFLQASLCIFFFFLSSS